MNREPMYEIFVSYLGIDYRVTADLWDHGYYNVLPKEPGLPEEVEILSDPEFYNYVVVDIDTDLEVIPETLGSILVIAENVLRELYWNRELSF